MKLNLRASKQKSIKRQSIRLEFDLFFVRCSLSIIKARFVYKWSKVLILLFACHIISANARQLKPPRWHLPGFCTNVPTDAHYSITCKKSTISTTIPLYANRSFLVVCLTTVRSLSLAMYANSLLCFYPFRFSIVYGALLWTKVPPR